MRLTKEKKLTTLAIVNVVGACIAWEADHVLYTLAGPEISVATTKAYSAQLAAMYCLAVTVYQGEGEDHRGAITAFIFLNCYRFRRKWRRFWRIKNEFSGLQAKYANAHDVFFCRTGN